MGAKISTCIYVGHSPAHAGSVALVLNLRTGHVSPQYHVVFNDLFTTVPFMEKSKVPPNWADLVEKSCEKVTDEHYELAKTWLFPGPEPGDISMPERNLNASNNSNLGAYSKKTMSHTGIKPWCPSSFLDKTNGLFQNMDYVPDPFPHPVSSSYEGANLPSQVEDSLVVPHLINLETSSQQQSPRVAAIINRANHNGLEIAAYTTSPRNSHQDGLHHQSQSFLSSLSSIQLVLFGHLPLRIIIQMNNFLLWPKHQMILNKSNASLMTQSTNFVIMFWHLPLQMKLSLTHKCFKKGITSISLRLWKLNSMIMKLANTGH
jgi:hypothetical protein